MFIIVENDICYFKLNFVFCGFFKGLSIVGKLGFVLDY